MKRLIVAVAALALLASCREEKFEPVAAGEEGGVQATAYNFHVYPGASFLEAQTDVLRRAHFVQQPDAADAPPMAMYDVDAPVEQVAAFYAGKYGYPTLAESAGSDGAEAPKAYYTSGDLSESLAIKPITETLGMSLKFEGLTGPWRGAHIAPRPDMPRVTLQRPYFDFVNDRVVDRTLIIMVRE